MLQGFEKETEELTAYDINVVVPVIASRLALRKGSKKAVTNKEITAGMKRCGYKGVTPVKVRKVINHIRRNWLVPCLVATSKGYYVAEDAEEMENYEKSMAGRINEMSAVLVALTQQRKRYFNDAQV